MTPTDLLVYVAASVATIGLLAAFGLILAFAARILASLLVSTLELLDAMLNSIAKLWED